jgi:hypothetical protein
LLRPSFHHRVFDWKSEVSKEILVQFGVLGWKGLKESSPYSPMLENASHRLASCRRNKQGKDLRRMQVKIISCLQRDIISLLDDDIFYIAAFFHFTDGLPGPGDFALAAVFGLGIADDVAVVADDYCDAAVVKVASYVVDVG